MGKQYLVLVGLGFLLSCTTSGQSSDSNRSWEAKRHEMVEQQIVSRGVKDKAVLQVMRTVPRHLFVPAGMAERAYEDNPLPIGNGQTISQPFIVAYMTSLLELKPGDKVLEVGTGSGYQAAVLSKLAKEVYSIEIIDELTKFAENALKGYGASNVHVRTGDGYKGWPEQAPFDAIIVTAAPDHVPRPLIDQLKVGGHLVIPVGTSFQSMKKITRTQAGTRTEDLEPVLFVPMTGEAERKQKGH